MSLLVIRFSLPNFERVIVPVVGLVSFGLTSALLLASDVLPSFKTPPVPLPGGVNTGRPLIDVQVSPVESDRTATPVGDPLPGAPAISPEVATRLREKWARREPSYRPRTRHLLSAGVPQYTNRLFLESSPYLLQHAHNPVDWYPWGDEAFATAKRLQRPVLLSVGYSTCHWCHVMEEESFEDEAIARYLNENYVAIKVDREERPDIDAIYMSAVQAQTGSGGWPMTVWLTQDRSPFFGGTYFPARDGDRGARFGFLTLLRQLRAAYGGQAEKVQDASRRLSDAIRESLSPSTSPGGLPDIGVLHAAAAYYRSRSDSVNGGLLGAPKFPSSLPVRFLLRYSQRTADPETLRVATRTLEKMAGGGIYDHVGGGFHRYSTDAQWLVPHFEKMLYDNALLAIAYIEGYEATGNADFVRVAREILRYVQRDLTSPDGAFYSASDADSDGPGGRREEGRFFTWTPDEIVSALGAERSRGVSSYFGVTSEGSLDGRSVLHVARPLPQVAREAGLAPGELRASIDSAKGLLYAARNKRPRPFRDEKIVAAWNGLMIGAFARAALLLGDDGYARSAARAAQFVLSRMRKNGRLMRSFKDGVSGPEAFLDDYSFMIGGLIDLYEASGGWSPSSWTVIRERMAGIVDSRWTQGWRRARRPVGPADRSWDSAMVVRVEIGVLAL